MKKSSRAKSSAIPLRPRNKDSTAAVDDRGDVSKTVENAILLLDTVSRLGPITLGDLVVELKLNRTVVYRLLKTLERRCFVIRFGSTYVLGPTLIKLSESVLPAFRQIVGPTLQRLGAQTQETVSCAVRDGSNWLVLDQVLDNTHGVHVREEIGRRYPLHLGAHGHALMTTLSEDKIAAYYTKVPVPEVIRGEIATARTCGYAISLGELRKGILGIAVPGMFKIIPFSLAVIVPTLREPDVSGYLPLLLEAVSYVTDRIG